MHLSCSIGGGGGTGGTSSGGGSLLSSSPSISKFISEHPSLLILETQCSTMKDLHQVHSHIIKTGLSKDPIAISRLLFFTTATATATSSFPDLNYALRLFNHTRHPTLFMWNTLIRALSHGSAPNLAISIFHQMLLSPTPPNHLTFPSLFKSSAHLNSPNHGAQLHAMVLKLGLASDPFIHNSILAMYASCGDLPAASQLFDRCSCFDAVAWNAMILGLAKAGRVDESIRLFDEMPARTLFTWSSMISGYARNGRNGEAFDLFHRMQREGVSPNEHILVSLLGACSGSGALEQGKWIHSFIKKNKIAENTPLVITAIVDMYCKCGSIEEAVEAFKAAATKSLSSWNSMILGLATHGREEEAIQLFKKLQHSNSGLAPDSVTFIGILTACNHSGMVEEAIHYFKLMQGGYGIEPGIEHYGCLVDALGRAGFVAEAKDLIERMPVEPDSAIWGSLLSSSRLHGNAGIGNEAAARLAWLDRRDSGGYVGLSNALAGKRDFRGSVEARAAMREVGVRKERGCSLIEMEGEVSEFVASGSMHERAGEFYQVLDGLIMNLRDGP